MYPAIFLTMLPIMVTALPITSLTRDNVAKPRKNKLVVSNLYLQIKIKICSLYNRTRGLRPNVVSLLEQQGCMQ